MCTGCQAFVNLTQTRVIHEEGISVEKVPPLDWPLDKSVGLRGVFSIGVRGPSPLEPMPPLRRWS